MFGKLITLIFVLVTVKAFSLRSATNEEATEKDTYRLPTNVVPIHYDLNIESNIGVGDYNFKGETDTKIDVREPTKEIVLNWLHLTLDEAQTRLDNKSDDSFSPKEHLYDMERQMLTLVFDDFIAPAIYTLHIEFSGVLSQNLKGFYGSTYTEDNGDRVWLALTHFQPISARTTFPCWDEPALKATFNISVRHHAKYMALSNMPAFERSDEDGDEAKVWTRFEKTPAMSTHILGFVIGDLGNISTPDGNIRVWGRKNLIPNLRFLFDAVQKVNDNLEDYMNTSVAVPKMDHVAVPEFSSRATENWGLIIYSEMAVAYYPNETTMNDADGITMLALHEMTHQWISNLVGPRWWKYMWMSEGFAAYFQFNMISKLNNDTSIMEAFPMKIRQKDIIDMDRCPSGHTMNRNVSKPFEIRSVYSYVTYRKAPIILQMLTHCMSEEVFRAGLLEYLHAYQYKTAVPDDLWRSMQDALDQSNISHEGFKIKEVMDTWTELEGYPVITINRDYDTGVVRVCQVSTQSEMSSEECLHKWWVPLNFATEENPDFSSTLPTHWLNPLEDTKTIVGLPKDGWILANIQQTGYYRVKYDLENWRRLARYLNSDDFEKIHVLNRFQIIYDAFNGVMTKELPYDVFGIVLNYLSREADPLPWMAAMYLTEDISYLFKFPETSSILKPYIRHILSKNLEHMDYKDRPDDERWVRYKKHIIKTLSCLADVPESLGNATIQLTEYLENANSTNILPDSRKWVLCCGLKKANQSTWNAVLDLYVENQDWLYLTNLACSDNKNILNNFLNMTLSDDSPFMRRDIEGIYKKMITRGDKISIDSLIDFLGKNLNELSSKMYDVEDVIQYLSNSITTTEQLDKMTTIFASRGKLPDEMIQSLKDRRSFISEAVTYLQIIAKNANLPSKK